MPNDELCSVRSWDMLEANSHSPALSYASDMHVAGKTLHCINGMDAARLAIPASSGSSGRLSPRLTHSSIRMAHASNGEFPLLFNDGHDLQESSTPRSAPADDDWCALLAQVQQVIQAEKALFISGLLIKDVLWMHEHAHRRLKLVEEIQKLQQAVKNIRPSGWYPGTDLSGFGDASSDGFSLLSEPGIGEAIRHPRTFIESASNGSCIGFREGVHASTSPEWDDWCELQERYGINELEGSACDRIHAKRSDLTISHALDNILGVDLGGVTGDLRTDSTVATTPDAQSNPEFSSQQTETGGGVMGQLVWDQGAMAVTTSQSDSGPSTVDDTSRARSPQPGAQLKDRWVRSTIRPLGPRRKGQRSRAATFPNNSVFHGKPPPQELSVTVCPTPTVSKNEPRRSPPLTRLSRTLRSAEDRIIASFGKDLETQRILLDADRKKVEDERKELEDARMRLSVERFRLNCERIEFDRMRKAEMMPPPALSAIASDPTKRFGGLRFRQPLDPRVETLCTAMDEMDYAIPPLSQWIRPECGSQWKDDSHGWTANPEAES
ncbi:uncharacterized protein FIBRA_05196 [Fibroporia radiculosa]|uniref:Uncharacterized protein n=1 Tax=Fibroporia radiculosa TaxID=599839 RepID=J4IAK6_9APHY|nr:uncharacterized protein FIBRA_05196 [Fibroporia radiculosa]CCM03076.1 predicted protein [Fibroporia radiculosa]